MNPVQELPNELSQLKSLVKRAEEQRDVHSIDQLQRFIENNPTLFQVANHFKSEVQDKLLNYIASGSIAKKSQLKQDMESLKAQLVGNQATNILDQLMMDEVTTSFLFLRYTDALMVRHIHEINSLDIRKADYASTRFARAIKTLHKLRSVVPYIRFNQVHITNQESSVQQAY